MFDTLIKLKEQLGRPYYEGDGFLIYCGDCRELMAKINGPRFQLTVTSPPYNIGKEYESDLSINAYLQWCKDWICQIDQLTSRDGAFWLNLGYLSVPGRARALPIPYLLWDRIPFYLVQEIVWNYGAGVACRTSFSPRNEKFLWYVKNRDSYVFNLDAVRDPDVKYPNQKKNGKLRCNPLGKNPTDVWRFPKVTSGENRSSKERTPHPAQFPVAVINRIVKACSNPGDIVFDPFLGSGTTIEAARMSDRMAIGFEINPDYAAIAARRIESMQRRRKWEARQKSLFVLD